MQLMRLGATGAERPVVRVDESAYVDVSDAVSDFDEAFFAGDGIERLRALVDERAGSARPFGRGTDRRPDRAAAPDPVHRPELQRPRRGDRAGRPGRADPVHQVTEHPDRPERRRSHPSRLHEDRLGGRAGHRHGPARQLPRRTVARPGTPIAGFVLVNDVSEREFQLERSGQWSKGKSAETFNPAGPWLATPDEIEDVLALDMWLEVNGHRRQTGSTSTMVFDPLFIVHYLSQFMVLEPGDLINTGTPPGVGMGLRPPVWLRPGDVIELGIDRSGQPAPARRRSTVR